MKEREQDLERRLVFIDLVKALGRIKCWEYLRIENIQYRIKSDTKAGLIQILSEILGNVTKYFKLQRTQTKPLSVTHSN
jgi:hypothetical protein